MILADKIIRLRKKNGWSQEEFAEKMDVSRQAVSKWESSQVIPSIEKILQMASLFGVTTDYLLKDEIENEEFTNDSSEECVKRITIEEANTYLNLRKRASWLIALATFLCILSPIPLIFLSAASEVPKFNVSETSMCMLGLCALFALILCAVPMFIYCGFKNEPYEFLEKSIAFELEYGVKGLVSERKKKFRDTYVLFNILATCICIFSPIPLILSAFIQNDFFSVIMLAVAMFIAGIGVSIFIIVGVQNASMEKLLQQGEYSKDEKNQNEVNDTFGSIYWAILTAIYFIWSFCTFDWHITWLVFAIGGILFPVFTKICNLIKQQKQDK